jgi:hypothetical protein
LDGEPEDVEDCAEGEEQKIEFDDLAANHLQRELTEDESIGN